MVIVCGQNMGDIFRRNSFNLGLHVVQSPEAVADAQDGDEMAFDPITRQLRNVTQGKTYEPVLLSPKEEEIRRSGGIFVVGRREFRKSVLTRPSIEWPEPWAAEKMTTTEQIVWAHRVDKDLRPSDLTAGHDAARLRRFAAGLGRHGAVRYPHVQPDHRRSHYRSAPGGNRQRSLRVHRRRRRREANIDRPRVRAPARDQKPYYATPGDGIFHFYFPSRDW